MKRPIIKKKQTSDADLKDLRGFAKYDKKDWKVAIKEGTTKIPIIKKK